MTPQQSPPTIVPTVTQACSLTTLPPSTLTSTATQTPNMASTNTSYIRLFESETQSFGPNFNPSLTSTFCLLFLTQSHSHLILRVRDHTRP